MSDQLTSKNDVIKNNHVIDVHALFVGLSREREELLALVDINDREKFRESSSSETNIRQRNNSNNTSHDFGATEVRVHPMLSY